MAKAHIFFVVVLEHILGFANFFSCFGFIYCRGGCGLLPNCLSSQGESTVNDRQVTLPSEVTDNLICLELSWLYNRFFFKKLLIFIELYKTDSYVLEIPSVLGKLGWLDLEASLTGLRDAQQLPFIPW